MSAESDKMFANLEAKTGHDKEFWLAAAQKSGFEKHGQILSYLKSEFGIGHGYANLIAMEVRGAVSADKDQDLLVETQYEKKPNLRPIHDRLVIIADGLGADVQIVPKKASVSLRRKKQFALIEPKTKTRVDLGLNLKGHAGTDRLRIAKGMCTHIVGLAGVEEIDDELRVWLQQAYDLAG